MLMVCWHHRLRAAWSWNEIRANTIKMIISLTTFVGIYPSIHLIENQYNYHILFGWMRKKKFTRSSPNFDRMKLNFGAADTRFSIYEIRWMWTLFFTSEFCLSNDLDIHWADSLIYDSIIFALFRHTPTTFFSCCRNNSIESSIEWVDLMGCLTMAKPMWFAIH